MTIPPIDLGFLRSRAGIVLALATATTLGCSFSYSSDSSSDSSNHSSDSSTSSSGSSSPDHGHDQDQDHEKSETPEKTSSFDQDVEQYTVAFLDAGGSEHESYLSGLGDLARQHGVSDWEADLSTWEAIGRGLARSHASTAERTAYQAAWTGGDTSKQSAVAKGISTAP